MKNLEDQALLDPGKERAFMPVYLRLENPIILPFDPGSWKAPDICSALERLI